MSTENENKKGPTSTGLEERRITFLNSILGKGDETEKLNAKLEFANRFLEGHGGKYSPELRCKKDVPKAMRHYKEVVDAKQDKALALHIGDYYRDGNQVEQNLKEAVNWYLLAIKYGDKRAAALEKIALTNKELARYIGDVYRDGNQIEQYKPEAIWWYANFLPPEDANKALNLLNPAASGTTPQPFSSDAKLPAKPADSSSSLQILQSLDKKYSRNDSFNPPSLQPDLLKDIQENAIKGDPLAQYNLGLVHLGHFHGEENLEAAVSCFRIAALISIEKNRPVINQSAINALKDLASTNPSVKQIAEIALSDIKHKLTNNQQIQQPHPMDRPSPPAQPNLPPPPSSSNMEEEDSLESGFTQMNLGGKTNRSF